MSKEGIKIFANVLSIMQEERRKLLELGGKRLKEIGYDNPRTKEEQRSINQDIRLGQMLEEVKDSVKHEFCKITMEKE